MAVSYQVDNVGSLGRRRHGCDWPLVSITVKTGASFPFSQVDKIGSHVMANASREQMSYTIDVLKTHTPAALELLCDSVLNPALEAAEVRSVWWATRRPGGGLELLCDSILNPALEGGEDFVVGGGCTPGGGADIEDARTHLLHWSCCAPARR